MASAPVETKVTAASVAATLTGLVLWTLHALVFTAGVPEPVEALVLIAVPGIVTFLAGWSAKHTPRPDVVVPGLRVDGGHRQGEQDSAPPP